MKQLLTSIFLILSFVAFAVGEDLSRSSSKLEINKAVEQLNTDVAAWNKRCKTTNTPAEEAWCKKERTRIDARKAQLADLGALPR